MIYETHPRRLAVIDDIYMTRGLFCRPPPNKRATKAISFVMPDTKHLRNIDVQDFLEPVPTEKSWDRVVNSLEMLQDMADRINASPGSDIDVEHLGDQVSEFDMAAVTCSDLELPVGYTYFHFGRDDALKLGTYPDLFVEGVYVGNMVNQFPGIQMWFVTNHPTWLGSFDQPFPITLAFAAKAVQLDMPVMMPVSQIANGDCSGTLFDRMPSVRRAAVQYAAAAILYHAAHTYPDAHRARAAWNHVVGESAPELIVGRNTPKSIQLGMRGRSDYR
jgi:hypothetical protein